MKGLRKVALGLALICASALPTPTKASTTNSSQAYVERLIGFSQQREVSAKAPKSNPFPTTLKEYMNGYSQQQAEHAQKYFPLAPPETTQGYSNFFYKKVEGEGRRDKLLLRNIKNQNTILKYGLYDQLRTQRIFRDFIPTEEERKQSKKTVLKTLRRSLRETGRASPDIKEAKNDLVNFLKGITNGFYVSAWGDKANGYKTGFEELDEERRQEGIERKNRLELWGETAKDFGRWYRFELGGEIKWNLKEKDPKKITLTKFFQGVEAEMLITDFKIGDQKFYELKVKACLDQELRIGLIKILNDEWYAKLSTRYGCFPGDLRDVTGSITQSHPNSRLDISTTYSEEEINKFLTAIKFIKRF